MVRVSHTPATLTTVALASTIEAGITLTTLHAMALVATPGGWLGTALPLALTLLVPLMLPELVAISLDELLDSVGMLDDEEEDCKKETDGAESIVAELDANVEGALPLLLLCDENCCSAELEDEHGNVGIDDGGISEDDEDMDDVIKDEGNDGQDTDDVELDGESDDKEEEDGEEKEGDDKDEDDENADEESKDEIEELAENAGVDRGDEKTDEEGGSDIDDETEEEEEEEENEA